MSYDGQRGWLCPWLPVVTDLPAESIGSDPRRLSARWLSMLSSPVFLLMNTAPAQPSAVFAHASIRMNHNVADLHSAKCSEPAGRCKDEIFLVHSRESPHLSWTQEVSLWNVSA